jgi:hypothetical protein
VASLLCPTLARHECVGSRRSELRSSPQDGDSRPVTLRLVGWSSTIEACIDAIVPGWRHTTWWHFIHANFHVLCALGRQVGYLVGALKICFTQSTKSLDWAALKLTWVEDSNHGTTEIGSASTPTFILGNFWLSRHFGGRSCRLDVGRTVLDNVYFQE